MKAFHEVRTYNSNFMVWHSNYDNISFLAHWHREIELIYIRSGTANISITNHNFTASEGDLVVCDSGDIHYSNYNGMDNSLDFIIFDPSIVNSLYEYSDFSNPLITKESLDKYNLTDILHRLLNTLSKELSSREDYYEDIVKASLRYFWYRLKRVVPKNNSELQSQNRRITMLYDFQNLLSYMDEYFSENITLEFAAKKMHFSKSHFSKVFTKLTGVNFVKYLNMIRIEYAMEQLKNSNNKIIDIALMCGFNNVRSFNRVFKEITGYTPSIYSKLPDKELYNLDHYQRKSSKQQFVEKDSITIIKNKDKEMFHLP